MKTKVEINGYEIEIELVNGVINVVASKEGEPIEEFSIETEEGSEGDAQGDAQGAQEIQAFSDFDEEEDFEDENEDEDEDFEDENEDENEDEDEDDKSSMAALESFQSFLSKTKKRK